MPLSPLDLRHLRTLSRLESTGSLSRAAEQLFLTQSALSHQLRALETAYGVPLVDRDIRPLRLTPAGRRLLQLAREVLPRVEAAERDVARIAEGNSGPLRVAVECHTCFDWLMPAMDQFREAWPEVELDLVSGFHSDATVLLQKGMADLAILHDATSVPAGIVLHPLFRYETVALLSRDHRLATAEQLQAEDFTQETLIAYPVEDEALDLMKHVMLPAGLKPGARRNAELTVAIIQLVASRRGVAALPRWSVEQYVERGYVVARPIGPDGLWCELHAATTSTDGSRAYIQEFVRIIREQSLSTLPGTRPLGGAG